MPAYARVNSDNDKEVVQQVVSSNFANMIHDFDNDTLYYLP